MPLGIPLLVCTLALPGHEAPAYEFGLAIGPATPSRDRPKIVETTDYHVRASNPLVRAWIRNGASESPTLKSLLAELTASDIIVHIELVDRIRDGANGQLYFVTATPTARFLRIEITWVGGRAEMIALIAHELQHAAEVAGASRVRDSVSLSSFYLGMLPGNRTQTGHYDSLAARATEDIVRRELLGHRSAPEDELQLMAQYQQRGRPLR
jgi:hypothetical protein